MFKFKTWVQIVLMALGIISVYAMIKRGTPSSSTGK